MSVTYIVQGMLEYAKEKGSDIKLVSGGMLSLGYCYKSLDDLKDKVGSRNTDFEKSSTTYPNLALGGTIAPWMDSKLRKKGYFTKGVCGRSGLKVIGDFRPLIKYLLESYNYVWLYTDATLGYNPYDRASASEFNKTVSGLIR